MIYYHRELSACIVYIVSNRTGAAPLQLVPIVVIQRRTKSGRRVGSEWLWGWEGLGLARSCLVPEVEGKGDECDAMQFFFLTDY